MIKLLKWGKILNQKSKSNSEKFINFIKEKEPQVFLHWTDRDTKDAIQSVVSEIVAANLTNEKSLLLLARYNDNKKVLSDGFLRQLQMSWRGQFWLQEPYKLRKDWRPITSFS